MTSTIYYNLSSSIQRDRAFSPDFASPIVTKIDGTRMVFPTLHHYYAYARFDHSDYRERVISAWTLKDLLFCEGERIAGWYAEKKPPVDVGPETPEWKDPEQRIKRFYEGQRLKYEQNPCLLELLLDTLDDELVFDTSKYSNWFCTTFGMNEKGEGDILAGKDLMYLRTKFRKGDYTSHQVHV